MEGLWFNDNTQRRIKLRSAVVLVGKAPTKQKRIKAMWTMQLDNGGEKQISGVPEWLEDCRNFVMRNGETIQAAHVVKECNITMGDANLFRKTPTEAPKTQIDHFQIKQMGDSDDPDTVVTFETRTPFSTDLWNWMGQQAGEEFDVNFQLAGVEPEDEDEGEPTLKMTAQGSDTPEEDESEDDASEDEEDDPLTVTAAEGTAYEKARRAATSPQFDQPTDAQVEHAKRALSLA